MGGARWGSIAGNEEEAQPGPGPEGAFISAGRLPPSLRWFPGSRPPRKRFSRLLPFFLLCFGLRSELFSAQCVSRPASVTASSCSPAAQQDLQGQDGWLSLSLGLNDRYEKDSREPRKVLEDAWKHVFACSGRVPTKTKKSWKEKQHRRWRNQTST